MNLKPKQTTRIFLKLRNKNKKKNWSQRLQKKLNYFPKKRHNLSCTYARKSFSFFFGNSIFSSPKLLFFSSLFLTRFILNLKRVVRKRDKTLRKFWITLRVFFRVTYQSKGARMGKGKGKHQILLQKVAPFINFIEFRGVRFGRLLYFLKFFNSRLPAKLCLINHWSNALLNKTTGLFRSS